VLTTPRRSQLCNLNVNLSFPQTEALPYVQVTNEGDPRRKSGGSTDDITHTHRSLESVIAARFKERHGSMKRGLSVRRIHERDLTGRNNGTIDEWYGCDLYDAMTDYAVNFTFPWSTSSVPPLDIPHS
jgi:carboxypeptidase D